MSLSLVTIETHLRSLEAMGEVIENNHLVAMIKSKLPVEFNLKLEENRQHEWSVEYLRTQINKLIVAREKTDENLKMSEEYEASYTDGDEFTGEGLLSKEVKARCIYCGMDHWSDECQKFKTVLQRKTRIKGKCFICLSSYHLCRDCKSDKPCFYCKKKGYHHSSLCPKKFYDAKSSERNDDYSKSNNWRDQKSSYTEENDDIVEVGDEISLNVDQKIIMKTAKVCIQNPKSGKIENGRALLDTGAKHTYITAEKARSLGIERGPSKLVKLNTFGNKNPSQMYTNKTSFCVQLADGEYKQINAKICKDITGTFVKAKIPLERYRNIWKNLTMADDLPDRESTIKLDILFGNDYYEDIMKTDKVEIDNGLYLINSSIGWMFSGRVPRSGEDHNEFSMIVEERCDPAYAYWELETIGIKHESQKVEECRVIDHFNRTITMNDDRYQVTWPWRLSKYELPSNYRLCESRLKALVTGFKDERVKVEYDDIIKRQLDDGIIEEADSTKEYLQKDSIVVHYIPHHAVLNDNKPTKLRIVYEGCAKNHQSKKSLNDCIHRGPNMVTNLGGILLRFRMNKIAFAADIQKAYLQLQLHPDDRDVTRFLWIKDINKPVSKENLQEFRFCRVIWGIVCSAFLLAYTIYYHLRRYDNAVSNNIMKNVYVDNLISGSPSLEEAKEYYKETKSIFMAASMNMCKWVSNSKELMQNINPDDRCNETQVKILGMWWNCDQDTISLCKVKENLTVANVTKRSILKLVGAVYDPLGLFSPALLEPKLIIQTLWKLNIDWDAEIPEVIRNRWKTLANDLKDIQKISTKRCLNESSQNNVVKRELITFTDASKKAYAAAVYLKSWNGGSSSVNIVFSKSRLAPIKGDVSIPRLELLGVLIGCRASKYVADELGMPNMKRTILTDSQCVLEWYQSKREMKRFVSERIKEIRTHNITIGYVPSEENPADVASRGETVQKLANNGRWWQGPHWLSCPGDQWPVFTYKMTDEIVSAVSKEERKVKVLYETGLVAESEDVVEAPLGINEEKYSSHSRLMRVTGWCLRFINNLQCKEVTSGCLTVQEISKSVDIWTLYVQKRHFESVLNAIKSTKKHPLISQLGLYIDSKGILRCMGRFGMLRDHPKLLPAKSTYTNLCITRDHRRILHGGVSHTLSEARKEHWIIHGRSVVRKIIRQCLICLYWESGPFKTPIFAPLPSYVLSDEYPPFTFTGVDYLGPLFVRDGQNSIKNWVCLFTCLNVRAIHLELIADMSTENFLLCIRRFIARRGTPSLMISDNAPQFKLGSSIINKTWKQVTNDHNVQSYIADKGIEWKFTIEYAPWQGGFYERLIGITKRSLRKSIGRSKVENTELITILAETEAVVNCRPLVYIDDDINSGRALTPGHFLSNNYKTGVPDIKGTYKDDDDMSTRLQQIWKNSQAQLNKFWKAWSSEYFQALRERSSLKMKPVKGEICRKPVVGEVVIIKEVNQPRGKWKVAKIQNLIDSNIDNQTRAAKVILPTGQVLKRPLRLLYPLECNSKKET